MNEETIPETKQRHGCVTAWLILMIVANTLTALAYLVSDTVRATLPHVPDWIFGIYIMLALANVLAAVWLMRWKKIGFWIFVATGIVAFAMNIYFQISILGSVFGLLGMALLFAVLQIPKNERSAWSNLE
jgi:hypothetical protein